MSSKGVALVTGAARGIGRAISHRLANDGYDVAVNDLESNLSALQSLTEEIQAKGRRSISVVGNVAVEQQVKDMVSKVVSELGSLDVMIANAGIARTKLLLETTVEDLDQLYDVNIKGVFLCYKHAAAQMIAQGRGGKIIGASSLCGKRPFARLGAYVATKFAVRGLTQNAAVEFGKHNITVNAYAPGFIDTDMLQTIERETVSQGLPEGQFSQSGLSNMSISRIGKPEDISNLVSFLVSEDANYITGQTVSVDGGWHFD